MDVKHGVNSMLEQMADEILSSARPKQQEPKKSTKPAKQRTLSLRDLQPRIPEREYNAVFSRADRVALVQLLEWCAAEATATGDRQLDVNISYCPGGSNQSTKGMWLVWTRGTDFEATTLAEAVAQVLREVDR